MKLLEQIQKYLCLALVIGGGTLPLFYRSNFWPLSTYDLFSFPIAISDIFVYQLFAETEDGQEHRIVMRNSKVGRDLIEAAARSGDLAKLKSVFLTLAPLNLDGHKVIAFLLYSAQHAEGQEELDKIERRLVHRVAL